MNAKTRACAVRPDGPGFVPGKVIQFPGSKSSAAVVQPAARAPKRAPQPGLKSAAYAGGPEKTLTPVATKSGRLSFITGGLVNLYMRMNQQWISKGGGNNRDVGSRSKQSP